MAFQNSKILVFICIAHLSLSAQKLQTVKWISPTGTYQTHFNNPKHAQLPQGIIKVKAINKTKIVVYLEMQNGEPLLRSGSFEDTLSYANNCALFSKAEFDQSCRISFSFTSAGIKVKQWSNAAHSQCDFADGVNATGFYKKESSKVPDFKEF